MFSSRLVHSEQPRLATAATVSQNKKGIFFQYVMFEAVAIALLVLATTFATTVAGGCGQPEQKTAEAALRDKLFCNYQKSVRPVKYSSNQTVVQIELYPHQISVDEYREEITIHGNIQFIWMDSFLQWNPTEFEGIQILSMANEEIWIPDITVDVPSDRMRFAGTTSGSDCLVAFNGKVLCFPVITIHAACALDLYRFPYDTQNCTVIFLSPNYSGLHVNLNVLEKGVRLSLYRANKVWEIINFSVQREIAHPGFGDNSTFYPYLKCVISMRRHSADEHVMIVLPGLVFAALTLGTFLMGDMHMNRIAIAALTFLCHVQYCLFFASRLPSSGDRVPLVVTFFRDSLLISAVAIATAIVSHCLRKKSAPPAEWLSATIGKIETSFLGKLFFFRDDVVVVAKEDDTVGIIADANKETITPWTQLSVIIDRITFSACLLAHLILFFFFLP